MRYFSLDYTTVFLWLLNKITKDFIFYVSLLINVNSNREGVPNFFCRIPHLCGINKFDKSPSTTEIPKHGCIKELQIKCVFFSKIKANLLSLSQFVFLGISGTVNLRNSSWENILQSDNVFLTGFGSSTSRYVVPFRGLKAWSSVEVLDCFCMCLAFGWAVRVNVCVWER